MGLGAPHAEHRIEKGEELRRRGGGRQALERAAFVDEGERMLCQAIGI